MNLFLTTVLVLGLVLGSEAVCTIATCGTAPGTSTGTACTDVITYLTCVVTERAGCTTGDTDKSTLDTAYTTYTTGAATLGCSGADMASISATTLLLSLVAAYFKS